MGSITIQDKRIPIRQEAALVATGNDASATPFEIGPLPNVAIHNTVNATASESDPVHTCTKAADSKTVWFTVTASDTGSLRVAFANRRLDNGADSGTVLAVYDAAGAERACSLTPQSSTVITTRTVALNVVKGDKLTIEVSATLSGSAATAQLQGGVLSIAAQIIKP